MEWVLWQKGLTELRIAKLSITVLIKTCHEKLDFIVSDLETQIFKPMDQVLDTSRTCARLIKDSKGVD